MADLLDHPPSSGGIWFDNSTCLELNLCELVTCTNCTSWKMTFLSNPGRNRKSKCNKPWQIDDQNVKKSNVRKLQTAVLCWSQFVSNDLVKESPATIEDAALKIAMKLPQPRQSAPPTGATASSLHSITSPLVKARPRRHFLSPHAMQSPHERTMNRKKARKQESDQAAQEEIEISNDATSRSSKLSLWNQIEGTFSNLCINDIIDKTCYSLLANEQGESRTEQGDKMSRIHNKKQPHRSMKIMADEIDKLKVEIQSLQIEKSNWEFISMTYKDELDKILKTNEELNSKLKQEKLKGKSLFKRNEILNKNQIPTNGSVVVHKLAFSNMNKSKLMNSNIVKQLQHGKFVCNDTFCRRLLGEIMATHPSISFNSAADIVSLSRAQLLSQIDFFKDTKLTLNEVAVSSPSETTLRAILSETTADILFILHNKIFYLDKLDDGNPPAVFLSCDKGPHGNFIKIISWFSSTSDKVEQIVLDVDNSYGFSKQCAEAM